MMNIEERMAQIENEGKALVVLMETKTKELDTLNEQCKGLVVAEKVSKTIPTYEVCKMMNKEHWDVLRMLEGYEPPKDSKSRKVVGIIPTLNDHNVVVVDYFIESTYVDAKGETRKCYECTKMGCELLANKMTGEKGILFTAKYVKKFNEMEKALKQQAPSYTIEDEVERALAWAKEKQNERLLHDRDILALEIQNISEQIDKLREEWQKLKTEKDKTNLTHSNLTYNATQIAKELGFRSAQAFNEDLKNKGIQYKLNGTWVLKSKYADKGYMENKNGVAENGHVYYSGKWTGIGRDWLINEVYKDR